MTSITDAARQLLEANRHADKLSREQHELTEHRLVTMARTHGVSWAIIGEALGTTAGSARVAHFHRKAAGIGGESNSLVQS